MYSLNKELNPEKSFEKDSIKSENEAHKTEKKNENLVVKIEPLSPKEHKTIRDALSENKFSRPNFEASLVKQHEAKLNKIPDLINGQKISNIDKFRLLVGDKESVKSKKVVIELDNSITKEKPKLEHQI